MFSDARLKTAIKKLITATNGVEIVEFEYKNDPIHRKFVGVIAQQVRKIVPESVRYDKATGFLMVDYSRVFS